MQLARALSAIEPIRRRRAGWRIARAERRDPRRFGRGMVRLLEVEPPVAQATSMFESWSAELRLFAGTFAAGFLFVTCFIG